MGKSKNSSTTGILDFINSHFTEQLARGNIPWHTAWNEHPKDIDGQLVRGINVWLLGHLQYSRNVFLSEEQIQVHKLSLKPNEQGHTVIIEKESKKKRTLGFCKVYNVDQVKGLKKEQLPDPYPRPRFLRRHIDIYDLMPNPLETLDGGKKLYYDSEADTIHLPLPESFKSIKQWFSDLFYPLIISTCHPKRLNRQLTEHRYGLDRRLYSCDELSIELGCSMLCSYAGIEPWYLVEHYKNAEGWLRKIESDPTFITIAALYADQSVGYILNFPSTNYITHQQKLL